MTDEPDGQTAPEAAAAADRPATSDEPAQANKPEHPTRSDKDPGQDENPGQDEGLERDGTEQTAPEPEETGPAKDASDPEPDAAADGDKTAHSDTAASTGKSEEPAETHEAAEATSPETGGAKSAPPARRSRGKLAAAVSVAGELLITAGVVLGLFVAYSLWWTNVIADREAAKESDKVRENWAADRDFGDGSKGPGQLDTKDGIGFLHAPALGKKEILIKPGTNPKELNQGIAGYYEKPVKSAMPWDEKGNFSLAAHRDGHGAKFHNIHKLEDGDPLVFETKDTWYVYKVYAKLPETSKYNVDVLDPVPKESGKEKESRYITLTTCTPVYTSNYRYIVWGELERTEVVDEDRTLPKELVNS